MDIKEWVFVNVSSPERFARNTRDWDVWFGIVCWCLWSRRNKMIFDCERGWNPPPLGWLKINSDGVRMTDSRLSTCGGVMRDHAVKWLAGFARKVGTSTDSNAELWGAYDGLKMAWAVGAQQVILKMESMAAVKLIG
ncbi:hypothetical protein Gorai_010190 [Gossypium raimondii]|uniref:RNase H type-1 domain-containing protein n=1 Tax=Gossypium raimondii TaxID=29730 RepID=A0A7J8PVT5_GOSRA|nr:hypothetical protein [Gossypium raimondii]